jgi:hypothetical protein
VKGSDRAGFRTGSEGNGDFPALAFLVDLAASKMDDQTFGHIPDIPDLDGDKFGAPEGAGEAGQQERAVATVPEGISQLPNDCPENVAQRGFLAVGSDAVRPAHNGQKFSDGAASLGLSCPAKRWT